MTGLLKQFGPKEGQFKQYSSPLNPFNSWKVMFHVDRMKMILSWLNEQSDKLPPPVYVTVDPTNVCNHHCFFCISGAIQESDNTTLKRDLLVSLSEVLNTWELSSSADIFRINAIVLAGGGEPLVNPATLEFLTSLSKNRRYGGAEFSMITNGELLTNEIIDILSEYATWVGFSVDSGNSEDHKKMHVPKKKNVDNFQNIIDNIQKLCFERDNKVAHRLHDIGGRLNVGYKFNIHPNSVNSMFQGARIAKSIGCDEIQYKPTFVDDAFEVMPPIIDLAQNNIMESRKELEDASFKVVGQLHKFGPDWTPNHDFGACTMTPLGLVFSADGNMYLCCDRRGDPKLNLGPWHNGKEASLEMIKKAWGSEKHRQLIKEIQTSECPRCSFYFYNKVANEALDIDNMNRNFL